MNKYRLFISIKKLIMISMAQIRPKEIGMKALIIRDEINQFHWAMLKSVFLVLSILPVSQAVLHLWQSTEGSSQIMVGFFALSLMSSLLALCFWSALKASVMEVKQEGISSFERGVVQLYRFLPMLSLASMMSYLAVQI